MTTPSQHALPDPDAETDPREAVALDVARFFDGPFTPDDGLGVTVDDGDFDGLTNGLVTAVVWHFTGLHDGPFMGLEATGNRVTVDGVSLVRRDADDVPWLFNRHVDWMGLYSQLGLTLSGRPMSL